MKKRLGVRTVLTAFKFGVSVIALMLVSTLSHAQAAPKSFGGSGKLKAEVVFNEPGFHGKPDYAVEDKFIELVHRAVPGSMIRMSMYQISRKPIVRALIEASKRGVDVRLVLDGSNYFDHRGKGDGVDLLLKGDEHGNRITCSEEPCVKFCSKPVRVKIKKQTFGGSCGGVIINHNKFMLFSRLDDGRTDVVAQSSFNFENEMVHEYQDLIIIDGDKGLFDGFVSYWESQKRNHLHITAWHDAVGDGPVRAKFFPRIIGKDPILKLLRHVSCEIPGSTIRIAEANINRLNIASRLRDLIQQGCDVKVITKIEPTAFAPSLGVVKRLGSNILIMPYRGKKGVLLSKNSIHTKIIMIDAAIDHSRERRKVVLTGSHNLDFFSLHTNDETILEVEDPGVYDRYFDFWNRLNRSARESGLALFTGNDS